MNAAGDPALATSGSLAEAQARNVTAHHRNVGLVVETRPDWVTPEEIIHLRRLGVTKVQIGVQSLDDAILDLNKRGHDVAAVRRALGLLRTAGFKLHLHWMPNLYGATPDKDREDFARFFADPAIRPDELKIYPCSLIAGTELYERYLAGDYQPYREDELVALLADVKPAIPPYTRINRLFRDIPAHHIQAGVKASNLRQIVQDELARRGQRCGCIRCHEIRRRAVSLEQLDLRIHSYATDLTQEHFLHFVTNAHYPEPGLIAGFLRLSLPHSDHSGSRAFLPELAGAAMIREVHVYGPALGIGAESDGRPQHAGLGTQLIDAARQISADAGFQRLGNADRDGFVVARALVAEIVAVALAEASPEGVMRRVDPAALESVEQRREIEALGGGGIGADKNGERGHPENAHGLLPACSTSRLWASATAIAVILTMPRAVTEGVSTCAGCAAPSRMGPTGSASAIILVI